MSIISYPHLKYVFDRRHVATRENSKEPKLGTIELEVYHNRKRKYLPTGFRVYANQWTDRPPYYVSCARDAQVINERLHDFMTKWENIITQQCREENFSIDSLSVYVRQQNDKDKTFLEFFDGRNTERYENGEIAYNTWRSMRVVLNHVKACKRIVSFSDLTAANIQAFDDYLHKIKMRQTSIYKTHKKLKVYIHECMRRELIKHDPYILFSLRNGKAKTKRYLNEEEMTIIRTKVITDKKVARVRDLAVFQMFTGMAYADLMRFDAEKLEKRGDKLFYHDRRVKSDEDFQLVLLSPAVEVLEKYNYCLPAMTNQCYNRYLKELADVCEITSFSSHDLRRTYATFALSKGMSVEMVARTMGHADTRQTLEYARLLGKDVEDAMMRLDSFV